MNKNLLIHFLLYASLLLFGGCATQPAADSGYLDNGEILQENRERFPFHRVWLNPAADRSYKEFSNIYVAPINTAYLEKMEWYARFDEKRQASIQKAAHDLGLYMRECFTAEINAVQNKHFTVIEELKLINNDTAILEIAIVELIPTPAAVNRFTEAAGFFVPYLGIAKSLFIDDGSIAIEARVVDAKEKDVLLMFADREEDKSTPFIDVSDFAYFRHARQHIDTWAKQYVELLTTDNEKAVKDNLIKLKPL